MSLRDAGLGGLGTKETAVTVSSLVDALTHHVGRSLQLRVLRGEKELDLTVRAIEARNDYPEVQ